MLDTCAITGSRILQVSFCPHPKGFTLSQCLKINQIIAFTKNKKNSVCITHLCCKNVTFWVIFKHCVFVIGMESWWPDIPGFTFWPASSSHVPVRWASSSSVGRTISCDYGTQLTRKQAVISLGYGRTILRIYVGTHLSSTLKMSFNPNSFNECTKLDKNYTLLWARKMWLGAKHA